MSRRNPVQPQGPISHQFAAPPWIVAQPARSDPDLAYITVQAIAESAGLAVSAVTSAEPFIDLRAMLSTHIDRGHLNGLDWFDHDRAAVAANPQMLHADARSIVALGIPFYSGAVEKPADEPRGRIARYAWGIDYHRVFRDRLRRFQEGLETVIGRRVDTRLLSDTARIVDRAVSARAGLGWYGKHACLIVPGHGSWVMLGEVLIDLDIEVTQPLNHDCGRCSMCMAACPTQAIVAPYVVDTPRCLSFQTIEQRGAIPRTLRPFLGDWVFGCDICQEVCPYTGAAQISADADFMPRSQDHAFPRLGWILQMDESDFRETYKQSAVLRTKRRGLARNAAVALGNSDDRAAVPALAKALASHDEVLVRSHSAWALGALGGRNARAALESARLRENNPEVMCEIGEALEVA